MRWVWRFVRFLRGNCEVCGGDGNVRLHRIARGLFGASDAGRGLGVGHAAALSVVIPCPHCTEPGELLSRLPAGMPYRSQGGGDVA